MYIAYTHHLSPVSPFTAPLAVLMRPDGHVAWVGDENQSGLDKALMRWFGPAAAA
ncbi:MULTISPECIES: hypothetical protein [unclassified Bradyrhizobium]|uniref:aromatic-ring hydroxylase C-terminal domain-containing protein n=1 Tax=unclassified Bradyrhizobium TaxID=2631580 RepID=UPI0015CBE1C1|nr:MULTISPECIES: hypothetical protein [unclassified Bradyrhizobium]MBB4258660.1 uncharacterized membrane protein YfbV (UPF0208 family) [Bradyrhizobium sp. CIR3A]NYG46995.1 uncharacterized membrane protein YfbV (UPF0208 family) [Bradyrhizobium sp. IAR9]